MDSKTRIMVHLKKAFWFLLVWLVSTFSVFRAWAVPPVELFAKLPLVSNPKLSPDGKRLAMTIVSKGKPVLVVQPLSRDQGGELGKISVGDLYIHDYEWANGDRIVLTLRDSIRHRGQRLNLTRLLAVDWNGKNPVGLKMQPNDWGFYRQLPSILEPMHADNEHVLALLDERKDGWARPHVHKVNVYTGKKKMHQPSYLGIQYWLADSLGNVLVGEKFGTKGSTQAKTYYRENEDAPWRTLQKTDYFSSERLLPYKLSEKNKNILLLTKNSENESSSSNVDETLLELYEYDLRNGEVLGRYVNKELESLKAKIESSLPGLTIELLSSDLAKNLYTFVAYSDKASRTYYLYDRRVSSMQRLGREYPALAVEEMAATSDITYVARDGREIPAFFTAPNGSEDHLPPMVVYPHGGPWAHDEWGFDPWVQFFASRGYAVFQPQFRGSTGYGVEHEQAGYGEWGRAIQDDITDGVQFLVERELVDGEKVCIVGHSFGGYASAMGLVKTPSLYQCAVSINGVLDLPKFQSSLSNVLFSAINRSVSRSKDPVQFSPLHNVDAIKSPMLLIASKKDTVVPYQHSKSMYKKLKRKGKDVTYIELKEGEHWRTNEANELRILSEVDKFLGVYLN